MKKKMVAVLIVLITLNTHAQIVNTLYKSATNSFLFLKNNELKVIKTISPNDTIVGKWTLHEDIVDVAFDAKKYAYKIKNCFLNPVNKPLDNDCVKLFSQFRKVYEFYKGGQIKKEYLYKFKKNEGYSIKKVKIYEPNGTPISKNNVNVAFEEMKAKYSVPELTKEQMYVDFDSLISVMESYNAQIPLRNKTTGGDMISEMKALRTQIEDIKTTKEFSFLIYKVLRLTTDNHTDFSDELWFFQSGYLKEYKKKLGLTEEIHAINQHYSSYLYSECSIFSKVFYLDGKYFIQNPMELTNKDTTIRIEAGAELCTIDHKPLDQYVSETKFIQKDIRWSFDENKYYVFRNLYYLRPQGVNSVTFKTDSNKFTFSNIQSRKLFIRRTWEKNPMHYFEKDSILYIRFESMSKWQVKKLKKQLKKYKATGIKAVAIDLRGNRGGDDMAWVELLSLLIKEPVTASLRLAINKSDIVKESLRKGQKNGLRPISIDCLGGQEYLLIVDTKESLKPHRKSLKFGGEILLMVDENIYSSAGSFLSVAKDNPNIISIGTQSNYLLGKGLTPEYFILPHSKLYFSLGKVIDVSNTNSVEDIWNNKVQELIDLPLSYYLLRANTSKNKYSKDFLQNEDLFFKKVVARIRKKN